MHYYYHSIRVRYEPNHLHTQNFNRNVFREHLLSTERQLPVAGTYILSFATAAPTTAAIQTTSGRKIHPRIDVQRFRKTLTRKKKQTTTTTTANLYSLVTHARTHTHWVIRRYSNSWIHVWNICLRSRWSHRSVRSLYFIQICFDRFFLCEALEAQKPFFPHSFRQLSCFLLFVRMLQVRMKMKNTFILQSRNDVWMRSRNMNIYCKCVSNSNRNSRDVWCHLCAAFGAWSIRFTFIVTFAATDNREHVFILVFIAKLKPKQHQKKGR